MSTAESWWYSQGQMRMGPVSPDGIRQLVLAGKVDDQTLVWQEGMQGWSPLSDVPGLVALRPALPPELPKPSPREEVRTLADAGPGRRFLARLIDLYSIYLPITSAIGFFGSRASPAFATWIQDPSNGLIFGMIVLPLALLVEAVIFSMFGSTLGKALLGLKVTSDRGEPLSAFDYFQRQTGLYWYGLGMGFPFVNLYTMAKQRSRVAAGRAAAYDQGYFQVKAVKLGALRIIAVAITVLIVGTVYVTLFAIAEEVTRHSWPAAASQPSGGARPEYAVSEPTVNAPSSDLAPATPAPPVNTSSADLPPAFSASTDNETPKRMASSHSTTPAAVQGGPFQPAGSQPSSLGLSPGVWTNPITGKSVNLPRGFVASESNGGTVFKGPEDSGVDVLFTSIPSDPSSGLKTVAEAWQAKLPAGQSTDTVRMSKSAAGQPVMMYIRETNMLAFSVFYTEAANRIWQVAVVTNQGWAGSATTLAMVLKEELLGSL